MIRTVRPEHMDISHHISEFQHLLLGLHKDAALKPVNAEDEEQMAMLERVKIQALSEQNGSEWSGLGFTGVSFHFPVLTTNIGFHGWVKLFS